MTEQGRQALVSGLDPVAYALLAHRHPQWQGVDEHPQCPLGTFATLHPAHQDGAEHHVLLV